MTDDISREEIWLLSATVKWALLALVTGAVVGCGASAFIRLISWAWDITAKLGKFNYLVLFPGLLVSYVLVRVYTRDAKVNVVEAIHNDFGAVDLRAIPARLLATVITIATGGSSGRETPCAMIGAGLMYALSIVFKADERDCKKLVIIGSAAGISAVFGTPIAGALFGVEILYMGEMLYDVLFPAFIAGVVSSMIAGYFNCGHLPFVSVAIPAVGPGLVVTSVLIGIFFGLIAMLHVECIQRIHKGFHELNVPRWTKPLIGAAVLVIVALIFGPHYMGLHEDIIVDALSGKHVPMFSFLIKSFALAVTLGCGGSGGMLMPTMFVGAAAGSAVAQMFGLNPAVTSAIGFVALLAGATNTPIASTILAMELFGAPIAPFAGIACCGAYIVAGHRSLYSGQKMVRPKADLFVHKKNEEGEDEIVNRFEDIPYSKLIKFQLRETKKKIVKTLRGRR